MTTVKKEKPIIAETTSGQWTFHSSSAVFCVWLTALRSIELADHILAEFADLVAPFGAVGGIDAGARAMDADRLQVAEVVDRFRGAAGIG